MGRWFRFTWTLTIERQRDQDGESPSQRDARLIFWIKVGIVAVVSVAIFIAVIWDYLRDH